MSAGLYPVITRVAISNKRRWCDVCPKAIKKGDVAAAVRAPARLVMHECCAQSYIRKPARAKSLAVFSWM